VVEEFRKLQLGSHLTFRGLSEGFRQLRAVKSLGEIQEESLDNLGEIHVASV